MKNKKNTYYVFDVNIQQVRIVYYEIICQVE